MQYFTDIDFPPDTRSWKRPWEIVGIGNAQFMVDGASRHDIDQGALGNCWFLASAAALAAHHPEAFESVVPRNQSFNFNDGYGGRFVFNFYLNGFKQTVYVDDYLPTRNGQLVYCSNRATPNEFWPCLLEKAYAKFKGSYANLNGGHVKQALEDLTGRPVDVKDIQSHKYGSAPIFHFLQEGEQNRALIVAGIYSDQQGDDQLPNGLIKGHAYSVTKLHQLTTAAGLVNLIRLRNPWGRGEWNGAWSDSSPEMTSLSFSQQQELKFHTRDDGEFWMEFNEFVRNFHEINICYV